MSTVNQGTYEPIQSQDVEVGDMISFDIDKAPMEVSEAYLSFSTVRIRTADDQMHEFKYNREMWILLED